MQKLDQTRLEGFCINCDPTDPTRLDTGVDSTHEPFGLESNIFKNSIFNVLCFIKSPFHESLLDQILANAHRACVHQLCVYHIRINTVTDICWQFPCSIPLVNRICKTKHIFIVHTSIHIRSHKDILQCAQICILANICQYIQMHKLYHHGMHTFTYTRTRTRARTHTHTHTKWIVGHAKYCRRSKSLKRIQNYLHIIIFILHIKMNETL